MKATWSREFRTELFKRIEDVIKERERRIAELKVILDGELAEYNARPFYIRWAYDKPDRSYSYGSDSFRSIKHAKWHVADLNRLLDRVRQTYSGGATAVTLQDEEVRWVQ